MKVGDLVKINVHNHISDKRWFGVIVKKWTALSYPSKMPYTNTLVLCSNGEQVEVPLYVLEPLCK